MSETIREAVTRLFKQFAGQGSSLVIPRPYIDFCNGDVTAALLLSQILYWSDRTTDPNGWIAKSYDDWHKELGISAYQVKRAIKGDKRSKDGFAGLKALGVETKLHATKLYGGAPVLHYRVNADILQTAIMNFVEYGYANILNNVQNEAETIVNNVDNPSIINIVQEQYTETTTKTTEELKEIAPKNGASEVLSDSQNQISPSEIAPSPSKTSPTPTDEEVKAFIAAWLQNLTAPPATNQYGRVGNRNAAKGLIKRGYTHEQMARFMAALYTQPFWQGKVIPLTHIADHMPAWLESAKKPAAPTNGVPPAPAPRAASPGAPNMRESSRGTASRERKEVVS